MLLNPKNQPFLDKNHDLSDGRGDSVHLRDEDGGDRLVQRGPVHVDRRTDRQHKPQNIDL